MERKGGSPHRAHTHASILTGKACRSIGEELLSSPVKSSECAQTFDKGNFDLPAASSTSTSLFECTFHASALPGGVRRAGGERGDGEGRGAVEQAHTCGCVLAEEQVGFELVARADHIIL